MKRHLVTVSFFFLFACSISVFSANGKPLPLSCPDGYWYPFLYTQDDQPKGILYDIVKKAFENLEIDVRIYSMPFRRIVVSGQKGTVDGIVGIGFDPGLSQILDYPPGAEKDVESPWRIMQVDHVVVSAIDDSYEFEGDLNTLPLPVRVLQGDPVIDDLNKVGVEIQEVRKDVQNFLKLIRDKAGVIVTTSVVAELMNGDPRFQGKIKIHATPVASHSYHLVFTKKSDISSEEKKRIWREVGRLRDDYIFILQVFSRY